MGERKTSGAHRHDLDMNTEGGNARSQDAKIAVLNALLGGFSGAQPTHNTTTDHSTPQVHWNKDDFTEDRENIHSRNKKELQRQKLTSQS
jgi:hypothetical protein